MGRGRSWLAGADGAPAATTRARRTSLGALALTGASAIRLSLQFALLPLLARLVGPTEYGLVALAMPFILLANVLADGGMGYALGRLREASRELESTVFWITAAIGVGLALSCCAAALPMGAILHQPRLPLLIAALSPILIMNALTAVSNGRIIREGRFAVFAAGDLISTGAGAATAVTAALHGWGAWSLVAQQLVLWTAKVIWVTWNGRAALGFYWRLAEARALMAFGFSTIGAILADFISRNLDSLIVGAVLGVSSLGFYAMAYQIVRVPDMLISGPLYLYIYTAMSRTGGDDRASADLALAALRLGSAALAPLFCGLALVADLAVPLVLGEKWYGAIAPLQLLTLAGFFFCLCSIMATTVMGLGRSKVQLCMSMLLAAVTVVVVAVSARFGLRAVAAALATGMGLVAAIYIGQLARVLAVPIRAPVAAIFPAVLGLMGLSASVLAARALTQHMALPLQLVGAVTGGGVGYLAVLAMFRRNLIADLRLFSRAQADGSALAPVAPETRVAGAVA
jgi:O-antigen/teichoic acid export membrane protein